ncbi:MAG: hypothetical protein P8X57_12015, partial [Cyclobacteriaceae bacterium]
RKATCLAVGGKLMPLLSIWEPEIAVDLKKFAASGKNSLKKFLEEQEIQTVEVDSSLSFKLDTVDTPEERQNFLKRGRK